MKIQLFLISADENLCHEGLKYLPKSRRNAVSRRKQPQARAESLFGELIVRREICKRFGKEAAVSDFCIGEYGKPYFSGDESFGFSVSHSWGTVLAAVSDGNVGADIERCDRCSDRLIQKCCTPEEREYLEAVPDKSREFMRLWTRKEALSKLDGRGIAMGFGSVCVLSDERIFTSERDGFFLSAAAENVPECEIIVCTSEEILDFWREQ